MKRYTHIDLLQAQAAAYAVGLEDGKASGAEQADRPVGISQAAHLDSIPIALRSAIDGVIVATQCDRGEWTRRMLVADAIERLRAVCATYPKSQSADPANKSMKDNHEL